MKDDANNREKMAYGKDKIIIEVDEREHGEREEKKNVMRMLSFYLGVENYCVDIRAVKEVVRITRITAVPNTPEFVIGVMNLRGEIISVIDIGYFFGLGEKEMTKEARVIVTDVKGESMGVLVDRIQETLYIQEKSVQPTLPTIKGRLAGYTKGQVKLGDEILIVLDLEKILGCEEIEGLKEGGGR